MMEMIEAIVEEMHQSCSKSESIRDRGNRFMSKFSNMG
jgi:hypothetical protein